MRALRTTLVATAIALALGLAASAPASAHMHFGHWGFGHCGGWGGGYGVGLADVGGYDDCIRWRPIYDRYGDYVGRRPVNVCY